MTRRFFLYSAVVLGASCLVLPIGCGGGGADQKEEVLKPPSLPGDEPHPLEMGPDQAKKLGRGPGTGPMPEGYRKNQ